MKIDLNKINKIYFIGIGGIGISAVAGIADNKKFLVKGSDATESEIVNNLRQQGIEVFVPHDAKNIKKDINLIVRSVAVPDNNPEIIRALELNIPIITYPQFLGLLLENKFAIGVSGTDGKTTTTAMISKLMIDGKKDPTVVLGAKADFLFNNWRVGKSDYIIFESDEYRRAFINYHPQIAVITNINLDHLDYYKDEQDYISAFIDYIKGMPKDGLLIINADDENCQSVAENFSGRIIYFSLDSGADYMATNIRIEGNKQLFELWHHGELLEEFELSLPGRHNVADAVAAIIVALEIGIDLDICWKSLAEFKGVWRRFEHLGKLGRTEIIADYAHTPDAIRKNITAIRDFYPEEKILIVFQPHQYNRTKNFFNEFVISFNRADKVIVSDIYFVEGRENPNDFNINSKKLTEAIIANGVNAIYGGNLNQTEEIIKYEAINFDLILILGAGDIYNLAKNLVK